MERCSDEHWKLERKTNAFSMGYTNSNISKNCIGRNNQRIDIDDNKQQYRLENKLKHVL